MAEDIKGPDLTALLQRAALAPSAHNAQPWLAQVQEGGASVSLHPRRALVAGDPSGRQNTISVGAFLGHLVTAAAAEGLRSTVEYQCVSPLDRALTTVRFVKDDSIRLETGTAYADAIERRRTNRGAYGAELPAGLWELLRATELPDGVELTAFTEPDDKAGVGALVQASMSVALQLPAMRRELADLVAWRSDGQIDRGMYLESMLVAMSHGVGTDRSASQFLLECLDASAEAAAMGRNYATAPMILVLSTPHDGPQAWLDAGRALSALLLRAADMGLAHCIAAGPVEVPAVVPGLRMALGSPNRPQVLFRVGVPLAGVVDRPGRLPASP